MTLHIKCDSIHERIFFRKISKRAQRLSIGILTNLKCQEKKYTTRIQTILLWSDSRVNFIKRKYTHFVCVAVIFFFCWIVNRPVVLLFYLESLRACSILSE